MLTYFAASSLDSLMVFWLRNPDGILELRYFDVAKSMHNLYDISSASVTNQVR